MQCVLRLGFGQAGFTREAVDEYMKKDPSRPRYVAGAMGPTNRTASISPDVNDPGVDGDEAEDKENKENFEAAAICKVTRV